MTVGTENAYAERTWTGVEASFNPGFTAQQASHVWLSYFDTNGFLQPMVAGINFNASLDSAGNVTVTPLAFPPAPVTIAIGRTTPALQDVDFQNLEDFDAVVHGRLHDAAAMRAAEIRSAFQRSPLNFPVGAGVIDFRPNRIKAATPAEATDLTTKAYVDSVSGAASAAAALASQISAAASASTATGAAATASAAASTATTAAALLANPDFGFYVDIPSTSRDYGTYL